MRSSALKILSLLLILGCFSYAQQTSTVTVIEKPGLTTMISHQQATDIPPLSPSVAKTTHSQTLYVAAASSPADDGASGTSSAFDLSTGGMIAIIVVVVAVVIFGVVSTVLFVMAKRRQWNVRDSIKRASRRLTGRGERHPRNTGNRRRGPPPAARKMERKPGTTVAYPPGRKEGLAVEVKDVEKGQSDTGRPVQSSNTWSQRLRGNNWV